MIDSSYYLAQRERIAELSLLASSKQLSFLQNVFLGASGVLGILVSLHTSTSTDLYIRVLFVLSTALLALGILIILIAIYNHTKGYELLCQSFQAEAQKALDENRKMMSVAVPMKKSTVICEKTSYALLGLSVVLLTLYAACLTFA
jgi:hypothetical protein